MCARVCVPHTQGLPEPVTVSVTPEAGPSGQGRIGVSLTPATIIKHIKGSTVGENVAIASKEFARYV